MPTKTRVKYHSEWPAEWSDLHIELACLREWSGKGKTDMPRWHHMREAMRMIWPKTFGQNLEEWTDYIQEMVESYCSCCVTTVQGHGASGKSHNAAHIIATDYACSPMNTAVSVTTVTLPALDRRIWADLVTAFASIPGFKHTPHKHMIRSDGVTGERYVIEGFATSANKDAIGRIQGLHAPRNILAIDEAQETGEAVFKAITNRKMDPYFKCLVLGNPRERNSPFGIMCMPRMDLGGWNNEEYKSGARRWESDGSTPAYPYRTIRFNGLSCPNVILGKKRYPWMMDADFIESVRKDPQAGENSTQWFMFVLGDFAPDGIADKVWPQAVISRATNRSKENRFAIDMTIPIASLDPAFGGGDAAVMSRGVAGLIEKDKYAIELLEQVTLKIDVTDKSNPPDWQVASKSMELCKEWGVTPDNFILDTTSRGAGVHAFLVREWSVLVEACEFGGKPSKRRIRESDRGTPDEMYQYKTDELWFAAATYAEEGQFWGLEKFMGTRLMQELEARLYFTVAGNKRRIEPKGGTTIGGSEIKGFKSRLGFSPDYSDSMVLLTELIRRKGGIAGSVKDWKSKPTESLRAVEQEHALLTDEAEFTNQQPVPEEPFGGWGW